MKNAKKIMLWLCALCLSLPAGMAAAPAWDVHAETEGENEGSSIITNDILETAEWRYKYEGTDEAPVVEIVEYVGEDTEVTVPDIMDTYPVTRISESAFSAKSVITVELPKSISEIGDNAFYNCQELISVTIGESGGEPEVNEYASLGAGAFADCIKLKKADIPTSITRIETGAFKGCTALEMIDIPNSVTQIDQSAFSGCSSLASVIVPDSVMELQGFAFSDCTGLQSVVLSANLTTVAGHVFSGCRALESIVIPNGVHTIDFGAFDGCINLETAVIPDSVTDIKFDSFNDCSKLTIYAEKESIALAFADNENHHVKGIPVRKAVAALSQTPAGFLYMVQGEEIEIVGYTGSLAALEFPDRIEGIPVTGIAARIFKEYEATSVKLPDTIETIGDDLFSGCTRLLEVTLSESLRSIGDSAFSGCSALESIVIPSNVTYVGNNAFKGCSKLTNAQFAERSADEETEIFIGWNAFEDCDLGSISLPKGVGDILENTFRGNENLASASLPEGIVSIGTDAFYGCARLAQVKIPGSVAYIWDGAFWGCASLEEIVIPDSVTNIENRAFYYCQSLKKATIPASVKKLGTNAFGEDGKLTIYTTTGSAAHTYATENNIPVVLLDASAGGGGNADDPANHDSGSTAGGSSTADQSSGGSSTADQSAGGSSTADQPAGGSSTADQPAGGSSTADQSAGDGKGNSDSGDKVKAPAVAKVKSFKVTARKKALSLKWKKAAGVSGYQIQISTKKNFKGAKTVSLGKTKTKYTYSNLKSNKKYYVRIRAYKTYKNADGKSNKAYGKWVVISRKMK